MSGSITSTNAIYLLAIAGLYTVPQALQGFSADDIFDTASVTPTETSMGLDGQLSGGFVPVAISQTISLQADSDSNALFDAWYAAQQAARETYIANGIVRLPAINRSYVLTRGFLTAFAPVPDAKKMLQPRKYGITWQSIVSAPL